MFRGGLPRSLVVRAAGLVVMVCNQGNLGERWAAVGIFRILFHISRYLCIGSGLNMENGVFHVSMCIADSTGWAVLLWNSRINTENASRGIGSVTGHKAVCMCVHTPGVKQHYSFQLTHRIPNPSHRPLQFTNFISMLHYCMIC